MKTKQLLMASTLALGFAFLGGKGLARAEEGTNRPCLEDVKKFCPDAKSKDEIRACMKDHKDELSTACKEKMAQARQRMGTFREACGDDLKKFCSDVKPGKGAKIACLKDHSADLSPACQEALQPKK